MPGPFGMGAVSAQLIKAADASKMLNIFITRIFYPQNKERQGKKNEHRCKMTALFMLLRDYLRLAAAS